MRNLLKHPAGLYRTRDYLFLRPALPIHQLHQVEYLHNVQLFQTVLSLLYHKMHFLHYPKQTNFRFRLYSWFSQVRYVHYSPTHGQFLNIPSLASRVAVHYLHNYQLLLHFFLPLVLRSMHLELLFLLSWISPLRSFYTFPKNYYPYVHNFHPEQNFRF